MLIIEFCQISTCAMQVMADFQKQNKTNGDLLALSLQLIEIAKKYNGLPIPPINSILLSEQHDINVTFIFKSNVDVMNFVSTFKN